MIVLLTDTQVTSMIVAGAALLGSAISSFILISFERVKLQKLELKDKKEKAYDTITKISKVLMIDFRNLIKEINTL